jgi:Domain of unknown function (DUF4365)
MARAKQRSEQHLIDQQGEQLLRSKLPKQWVVHEYRPDYGLDFTVEVFKFAENSSAANAAYETLGEHFFIQLKSIAAPDVKQLAIFSRGNVEKSHENLNRADKVADIEIYSFQLETSELVTVERMGIAVPVLLVIADLAKQRCSFVCLNDYIDKILIPRYDDYRDKQSRIIHIPTYNEIGTDHGLVALRWYAKRPKLIAAFQRFTYQYSELRWAEHEDWRGLAKVFAHKIANYDFWNDTEMCGLIECNAAGLQRFMETGQPGFFKDPTIQEGFDEIEIREHYRKLDVFELWRQLSLLPKTYEDIWREWFLPTSLGYLTSATDKI